MSVCLHICVYTTCLPCAQGSHRRVANQIELKLQVVLNCIVGAGDWYLSLLQEKQVTLKAMLSISPGSKTTAFHPLLPHHPLYHSFPFLTNWVELDLQVLCVVVHTFNPRYQDIEEGLCLTLNSRELVSG